MAFSHAVRAAAHIGEVALWSKYRTRGDCQESRPHGEFSCHTPESPNIFAPHRFRIVSETRFYKRATFVAHLPVGHRYTTSHAWIAPVPESEGTWRVGLTRFAMRMLGELVEVQFEPAPGQPVRLGEIIGNIEGFKAISDLFSVIEGTFAGGNPAITTDIAQLGRDPHHTWLYQIAGTPDPRAVDVEGYVAILDATIDRILEQQKASGEDSDGFGDASTQPSPG